MSITTSWIHFFTAAGIPSAIAASYASTFTDNRIQENMLLDLNKEYLRDMGITCMGDVIAILRHAKIVHEETVRDRVLGKASAKVPAAVAYRLNKSLPELKTNNIIKKTIGKEEVILPMRSVLKRDAMPTTYQKDSHAPEAKLRKISLNTAVSSFVNEEVTASSTRSTIFDRLGQAEKKALIKPPPLKNFVITNDKVKETTQNTVFARLGIKARNMVKPADSSVVSVAKKLDEPLEYQGVLKGPPIMQRIITFSNASVENKISAPPTMRADETPISAKDKLRLTTNFETKKSVKFSNNVQYKEIEPVEPNSKVMIRTVKDLQSELLPINRRIINTKSKIQINIGTKGIDTNQMADISKGTVFSRLGI